MQTIPENVQDEGLRFAYHDADKHNWTKQELEAYDYVLMREQDDRGRMTLAIRRALQKEKEAFAITLLESGFSIEDVAKYTKLSTDQVQELSKE